MSEADRNVQGSVSEQAPPRGAHRRLSGRRLGVLLASLTLVLLLPLTWYELQVHPLGSPDPAWTTIRVAEGEGVNAVGASLGDAGVIASPLAFRLYTSIHGSPNAQPGTYAFHQGASLKEVAATLSAPPNAHAFDLPAGFTLDEVARRIRTFESKAFVQGFRRAYESIAVRPKVAPNATTLEGKVAPGVYRVLPDQSPLELLTEMVERFDAMAASVGLKASTRVEGRDALAVISIAAIVQKEGYYPSNMPKVARVVYNRLARGMPLQMDSTVLYSLGQDGGPVTPAMLKIDTPYNTYLYRGLTPTPIATPSREALKAAMAPPPGPWLYFVVVDERGTEAFSETYDGHLANLRLARSRGL